MTASRPAAEPLFNAPAAVLVVVASIVLSYLLQSLSPDPDAVISALGLVPLQVAQGRVWGLLTVMVVHASWAHALLNGLGALAFGTPVARWFGRGQALALLRLLPAVRRAFLPRLRPAALGPGRRPGRARPAPSPA